MKTLILCLFLSQNLAFIPGTTVSSQAKDDPFIHSVYFWLKEDTSQSDRMEFKSSLESLKKIRGIRKRYVLEPAGTEREVVDNSYDYALIIHFKNKSAQEAYQVDPLHASAVHRMQPMIGKFIVYDAE